jgi:hypothetical protein
VGVGVSVVRAAGVRLPSPLSEVATSAAAMVAGNASAVSLGVTDPRTWTVADWVSDVVPHLAYGITASAALRQAETSPSRRVGVDQSPAPLGDHHLGLDQHAEGEGVSSEGSPDVIP